MIYISDEDGTKGEFGSAETVRFFEDTAEENNLVFLKNFLENGFTIDLRETINDLESIEWPTVDGIQEVARNIIQALMKSKGMAIIQ